MARAVIAMLWQLTQHFIYNFAIRVDLAKPALHICEALSVCYIVYNNHSMCSTIIPTRNDKRKISESPINAIAFTYVLVIVRKRSWPAVWKIKLSSVIAKISIIFHVYSHPIFEASPALHWLQLSVFWSQRRLLWYNCRWMCCQRIVWAASFCQHLRMRRTEESQCWLRYIIIDY